MVLTSVFLFSFVIQAATSRVQKILREQNNKEAAAPPPLLQERQHQHLQEQHQQAPPPLPNRHIHHPHRPQVALQHSGLRLRLHRQLVHLRHRLVPHRAALWRPGPAPRPRAHSMRQGHRQLRQRHIVLG